MNLRKPGSGDQISGFSLIEVIIGLLALGLITTASLNALNLNQNASKSLKNSIEVSETTNEIMTLLSDHQSCTDNFSPPRVNVDPFSPTAVTEIADRRGKRYQVGRKVRNTSDIEIESMRIIRQEIVDGPTLSGNLGEPIAMNAVLELRFKKTIGRQDEFEIREVPVAFILGPGQPGEPPFYMVGCALRAKDNRFDKSNEEFYCQAIWGSTHFFDYRDGECKPKLRDEWYVGSNLREATCRGNSAENEIGISQGSSIRTITARISSGQNCRVRPIPSMTSITTRRMYSDGTAHAIAAPTVLCMNSQTDRWTRQCILPESGYTVRPGAKCEVRCVRDIQVEALLGMPL